MSKQVFPVAWYGSDVDARRAAAGFAKQVQSRRVTRVRDNDGHVVGYNVYYIG